MPIKVLILRFSSMGDIVLTTPVIRCLKNKYGAEVSIHYLCRSGFAGLLEANPHLDTLWTFESNPLERFDELEKEKFDHVVDLQGNLKSRILVRRLGQPSTRLKKLNFQKWVLVNLGIDLLPSVHIVERYMDTIRNLGVSLDEGGLDYFFPKEVSVEQTLPDRFVLFALGGAHRGKRMNTRQWISLIQAINFPVVLVGGSEDAPESEEIARETGSRVSNLTNKLSIHQSALLASKAALVVSGDTGMMHIASAFKAKIVSVWGCTVPKFGMYPFRPHPDSVQIEPAGLSKRPCSKLGNRCKYGMESRCITHIPTEQLAQSINSLWES